MTLTEFLLARIAEDEGWAEHREVVTFGYADPGPGQPRRVLAECEAKRDVVEARERLAQVMAEQDPLGMGDGSQLDTLDWVLKRLALPYADHPEFREEWRP